MATQETRLAARLLAAPSIGLLFVWMVVPLAITIYFSLLNYNLQTSVTTPFVGLSNYYYFLTDPAFLTSIMNTLLLVGAVLVITILGGLGMALLLDQPIWGQGFARIMVISPFFVMATVSALIWKNLMMHPVFGIFAWIASLFGAKPIDWFGDYPLTAIIIIVAWQWLPFAALILLTALQSFDQEQKDAAQMDGAPPIPFFFHILLPHLARPITVVILIETIFLLSIFAEIYVTTGGGPGLASTNLTFLIYQTALLQFDAGGAAAGGLIAVVLANIVAIFLTRLVGKNLEG
ncbi:MAG: sugar ABC transporter permease [Hyphomicrobiales bacterium]|nr:sugar ABC transporter permease [Hyphomicrobiales bacterium]MDE2113346.1 sugar ABC transporter permease [Hyphomicrobiales bacterium]